MDDYERMMRRLTAERFAPEVQMSPGQAAKARQNGPTAQFQEALRKQEAETVMLDEWRAFRERDRAGKREAQ